ncbi:tetratricopeptide repeat protein [Streptomyces citrinus]|uniref:tetratricopeptide repeat protein n=1 Tax=Streptomyces citrinus TaxID=3118173 RepID=UPI003CC614E6
MQQLGHAAEGVTLLQRATDGRERVLGKEHPLTLQSRAHLLEFLPITDLAVEVDGAMMPLPQECALHLGPDHAVTLGSRLSYAFSLVRLGRFEAAVEDARQVAQDYERCHGPNYALTLSAQFLYARVLAALGELEPAVELMALVAHRREQSLGDQHPYTARSYELLEELRAKVAERPAD